MPYPNNNTTLRQYLTGVHHDIRQLAGIMFEFETHPDTTDALRTQRREASNLPEILAVWDKLSKDLVLVLGPEAELVHGRAAGGSGTFAAYKFNSQPQDPFRIKLGALKLLADRARLRHPEITLLKSWDLAAKEPSVEGDN